MCLSELFIGKEKSNLKNSDLGSTHEIWDWQGKLFEHSVLTCKCLSNLNRQSQFAAAYLIASKRVRAHDKVHVVILHKTKLR